MKKRNLRNKIFKFYYDKEKTNYESYSYAKLVEIIKLRFIEVIKMCNIDNELRADSYIKIDTLLKQTLVEKFLEKHPGITEKDINIVYFEKIESLFIDTLRSLDIDTLRSLDITKFLKEEESVLKKYNDQQMSFREKLLEKELIEPNLWNRLDDYCKLSLENYPYDNPDSEYLSTWLNYQDYFINEFIRAGMFNWDDFIALPPELNPILPHLTDRRLFGPDSKQINFTENMNDIRKKIFKFSLDNKKKDFLVLSYEDLIQKLKSRFIEVIKECNIDQKRLIKKHSVGMYDKHLEINAKIESLFIETIKTLDIDNRLSDKQKYAPKKYNDQQMSLVEKLLEKKLIEPNLWNKFDDFSRLWLDIYLSDLNSEPMSSLLDSQHRFIYSFIKKIMFYWGDGLELPEELNPITPHLTDPTTK